jgi:MFS family permease
MKSFVLLAIILFMTRVGACAIEIMCDTYFFKKVDELNANIISFYRMFGSVAYIVSLLFATILFNFLHFEIKYLFFILGLIMLVGLKSSFSIKDTK